MSSLPGIVGLLIFIYIRPHEFIPGLAQYNFLYVFLFLSLAGMGYDISQRRARLTKTPMNLPIFGLTAWCLVSLGIRRPDLITTKGIGIIVSLILYLVIGQGVQRLQSLMKVIVAVFMCGLFVAYVGADQGLSPFQCVKYNPAQLNSVGYADGRECIMKEEDGTPHDGTMDCIATATVRAAYQCEKAGLFGTTSVGGGRVRYLGVLLDPNEIALATSIIVPWAFAFLEMRATVFRLALLLVTLVVVAVEIVFTGSRGGQITFGAALGAYFVKKYGWKRGALVGAMLAVPMAALGGRSGDSADHSTLERLNCAAEGIKMLMRYPVTGVGYSQFTEHHFLTAHNAYMLAAGELGLPGMWFFSLVLYMAIKIPVSVMRFPVVDTPESRQIKAVAMGFLAIFAGAEVGIFFLSWTYHYVLWIHFGLITSFYVVVKRTYPTFECNLSWKEARAVIFGYVAFVVVWSAYIKYKGAWDSGGHG
jgi:hypothetical protein